MTHIKQIAPASSRPASALPGPALLGIVGWKNSGKTTLTSRLIAELTRRGFKVIALKHAHHEFEIDHPGRDSMKMREAGASEVGIISSTRWALIHELSDDEPEPPLQDFLAKLSPCDIVLVEGHKNEDFAKIEIRGPDHDENSNPPLAPQDNNIIALVTDKAPGNTPPSLHLPHFNRDDIPAIAEFIISEFKLAPRQFNAAETS